MIDVERIITLIIKNPNPLKFRTEESKLDSLRLAKSSSRGISSLTLTENPVSVASGSTEV